MSDQRRDLHQMEDLLDQARNEWVEAERQRLLSRSIDHVASVHLTLKHSNRLPKGSKEKNLIIKISNLLTEELARNAEYTFNIPADEFTNRAKEKAKNE